MPAKSKRTPKKKQLVKKRSPNKGNSANSSQNARAKAHAASERAYLKRLRKLKTIGAYQPELKKTRAGKPRKLTKAQKAAINSKFKKFEEFLTGDHYIFVPVPTRSKKKRAATIRLAKKNQLSTAPKGVFIPKTRNTKSAVMVASKRNGKYRIKVKKVKKGLTGKKTITEIVPIEPMGSLENELERIRDDAELLELEKGESLAFKVEMGGNEGYSHQIFKTPELLKNYLSSQYHQALAHKLAFFRAVSVFKTDRETYFQEHPRKDNNPYKARANAKGRSVRNPAYKTKGNVRNVNARSNWITPFEQGYASYNNGFSIDDNPHLKPPERRQWQNGFIQAKKDDGN